MEIPGQYHHQALRKESSDEQALIGQRVGWLLACEGFLVTGYCIALGAQHRHFWWFPALLIPTFGIAVAASLRTAIHAACKTIEFWQSKEEKFYQENRAFQDLNLAQRGRSVHFDSMKFPQWLPAFFVIFWLVAAAATVVQMWWAVIPVPKTSTGLLAPSAQADA